MKVLIELGGALLRDENGAQMVEYALILMLVAIVCLAAVTGIGQSVLNFLSPPPALQ